jgi:hypothetical protein
MMLFFTIVTAIPHPHQAPCSFNRHVAPGHLGRLFACHRSRRVVSRERVVEANIRVSMNVVLAVLILSYLVVYIFNRHEPSFRAMRSRTMKSCENYHMVENGVEGIVFIRKGRFLARSHLRFCVACGVIPRHTKLWLPSM